MVKYVYDAWGNHKVLDASGNEITDSSHIGNRNPFRYRSYYYDTETGLYYLKARYYDPEVGRFISADDLAYIDPDHVNGTDLYAYCYNNPVRYIDKLGWNPIDVISEILSLIEAALSGTGQTQIVASNKAFSSLRGVSMYVSDSFGGAVLNPSYLACLTRATNLQYNGKVLNVSGKILNGVGYVLLAVDIGLSIYGNATNPNLSTSRKVTDSIIDVGFSIASFVLATQVGAAFGSMIPIPVVGTLVGAIAGMIVGAAVMLVKEQIGKDLKESFNKFITKTIPNAWNEFVSGWNKFWSFG